MDSKNNCDLEKEHKTAIKEEPLCQESLAFEMKSTLEKTSVSKISLQKDEVCVSLYSTMESENNVYHERELKKIKEEPLYLESMSCEIKCDSVDNPPLDVHLEKGLIYVSCNSVIEPQNKKGLDRVDHKTAIKEELLWKDISTEIPSWSKVDGDLHNETVDCASVVTENVQGLLPTETQRSSTETICDNGTGASALSNSANLQADNCIRLKEDVADCKTSDFVTELKNNGGTAENNETQAKIEINEDSWWDERTSTVKSEPEDATLAEAAALQNGTKDSALRIEDKNQESLSIEASRLCSCGCGVSNKACIKLRENTSCEKDTIHAAHGDDTTDPSHNADKPVYMLVFVPSELLNQTHLCKICNKTFTTASGLKSHILKHEGKLLQKCSVCDRTFAQAAKLKLHMLIHDGIKPHKCQVCEKSFNSASYLKKHNFLHEGESPHRCKICEKCFSTANSLKVHNLIHEGTRPHECKVCGKTFTQASNLWMHNLIHEGKRPHKCNICGKCFTVASRLKLHNLIHEGKRPHKCSICEKSFIVASELNAHSLVHDGKGPHKCKICDKNFTRSSKLKRHILIHEEKQELKCIICDKSFIRASMLKRHILIHEEKRSFKCKICGKGFTQASNLKTHSMIHEGRLPYKCNICDKSFTHASKLGRHNLIHENKQAKHVPIVNSCTLTSS